MWVPGGVTYLLATLWIVSAWLRGSEQCGTISPADDARDIAAYLYTRP